MWHEYERNDGGGGGGLLMVIPQWQVDIATNTNEFILNFYLKMPTFLTISIQLKDIIQISNIFSRLEELERLPPSETLSIEIDKIL